MTQRTFIREGFVAFGLVACVAAAGVARAGSCESLATLDLKNTQITLARRVAAGQFTPGSVQLPATPQAAKSDAAPAESSPFATLPAFCRVVGKVTPAPDSDIGFEVWLPVQGWNGKLAAAGNDDYGGEIPLASMASELAAGYVAAGTDTGHKGAPYDASFALNHPQRIIDFGYRAVHELAAKARALTVAFYGSPPRHAYWNGCGTGGRQGLMAAQRFPTDFDGIVAGAPANYMSRLQAKHVVDAQVIDKAPGRLIPPEKLPMLHRAVLDECDVLDGVKDAMIEDPLGCRFDPGALRCADADAPSCLTPAQVASAQLLYRPLINPLTQVWLFPGLSPGSELGWARANSAMRAQPSPLATGFFAFIVFKRKNWDYRKFDITRDMTKAEVEVGDTLDAINPNLTPYFDHGGKLLQYHGWADPVVSPLNSINYYERVRTTVDDANLDRYYRLFMVPGMGQCGGGTGPNRFDALQALDGWVMTGRPPARIIVSRRNGAGVVRTRPLCPYPQIAVYDGAGSVDLADSFSCAAPPR